jgi:hypothetical protein
VYLILKVLNPEVSQKHVQQQDIVLHQQPIPHPKSIEHQVAPPDDSLLEKPWTLSWTSEPETFTVSGPLPFYDKEEDERQKISADGNDGHLESYMKQREDFSKTLETNKNAV